MESHPFARYSYLLFATYSVTWERLEFTRFDAISLDAIFTQFPAYFLFRRVTSGQVWRY
jgi:hypothetical protein